MDSEIWENCAGEIRNPGLWNPESQLGVPIGRFPVPGIWNPRFGIQNPGLSCIPLYEAIELNQLNLTLREVLLF